MDKVRPFGNAVILLMALAAPSLVAQYGPKDGQDLSPYDLDRVQLGHQAPDFTLQQISGEALTLSSLHDKNIVLVFYRGHW